MSFAHGLTVSVLPNAAAVDKYGDTDDAAPTPASWGPVAVAPRTSAERADSRSPAVVTGLTIYGPTRTFGAKDQITIATGQYAGTWQVEGIPGDWQSPFTGWAPGVEVAVTRASAS